MSTVVRERDLEAFIDKLKMKYEMKDIGEIAWFLNVRLIRDRAAGKIWLCQDSYIDKIAAEFKINVSGSLPKAPMPYEELTEYAGDSTPAIINMYAKRVGSVIYPAVTTRPDIARASGKLAEFMKNPGPLQMAAADHCIQFLYATKFYATEFSAMDQSGEFIATTDKLLDYSANALGNNPDRRSGEGYAFNSSTFNQSCSSLDRKRENTQVHHHFGRETRVYIRRNKNVKVIQ